MAENFDLQQTGDQVQQYLNSVPEMTERTKDTAVININAMADSLAVFTLTSAIEALTAYEQANNVTYRKSGIVLSYKTANNTWESKQFLGDVEDFDDETLWEDFGSGKVKTVSVNGGDAVQPDEHGNIDIEVPTDLKDLNEDSTHRTVTDAEKTAWSGKQPAGDYATKTELTNGLATKQPTGDYATRTELAGGLATKQPTGDYATNTALSEGLAGKQGTISDLDTIRSGAGKGATSVQGVKMEGDDNPLTPGVDGVVTIPQPEIPDSVTSVITNNELVFQTPDGQSVKGKVGISTGADGLLHLTLTDEEGNTYSSPIAGLRVNGNALQYSNDGETWVTVQTFGKLAIKYVQASDPASGDEGDLALVGTTNAYVLKVYVGGSWVSVCDFGTLDLTSDGITMVGQNKTLTQFAEDIEDAVKFSKEYTFGNVSTGADDKSVSTTNWSPLDHDVVLTKVTFGGELNNVSPDVATTIYIGIVELNNGSYYYTRKYTVACTLGSTSKEVDLTSYNIVVPRGAYVSVGNKQVASGATTRLTKFISNSDYPTQYKMSYSYGNDNSTHSGFAFTNNGKGYGNYKFTYIDSELVKDKVTEHEVKITNLQEEQVEVVDELGDSATKAISQKAVTDVTTVYENKSFGKLDTGAAEAKMSYTNWEALDHDVILTSIDVRGELDDDVETDTTVSVSIVKVENGTPSIKNTYTANCRIGGTSRTIDLSSLDIVVPAGCYVMLHNKQVTSNAFSRITKFIADANYPMQYVRNTQAGTFTTAGNGYANYVVRYKEAVPINDALNQTKEQINDIETYAGEARVSYKDCTDVAVFGSSLTACGYAPEGMSWIEKINDLCDVNICNYGWFGNTLSDNLARLATLLGSSRFKYVMVGSSANTGQTFDNANNRLLECAYRMIKGAGAEMLLQVEDRGGDAAALNIKSFAKQHQLKASIVSPTALKLWNLSGLPNGLQYSSHGGYRAMSVYGMHQAIFDSLAIRKSVKMFRLRTTYKGGSVTINDLKFDTNEQRLTIFKAVSPGRQTGNNESFNPYVNTNAADSLDSSSYAVSGGESGSANWARETISMKNGSALSFNKFALVEFILDRIMVTKGTFEVVSNVEPSAIYIAKCTSSSTTFNDTPRTTWELISHTYEKGVVTASVNHSIADLQMYDKVRIIVEYDSGNFTLAKPVFYGYNGKEKDLTPKDYHYRKYGTELMNKTSVEDGYTLGGTAAVASLPQSLQGIYTSYNSVKSHVELKAVGDSMSKSVTLNKRRVELESVDDSVNNSFMLTQPCSKLAVRVVAMMFPKIANTRYESGDYVRTDAPSVKLNDYDYGTLRLEINGNVVRKSLVWDGWQELYFEVDVEPSMSTATLALYYENGADSNYKVIADSWPMMIHDVSVQAIE